MAEDITPPELLAYDAPRTEGGNVRPADDRYLAPAQKRKRTAYVARVEAAKAEADAPTEDLEDPLADVLQTAVDRALTEPESRPDATTVTSPRGSAETGDASNE